jgi:pimeloyl-ACP methyl ester carboxylesterase
MFLHGLGQTPQDWQDQVTALPDGWSAHAPWLAGLNPTDKPAFKMDEAVAALVSHLDAHGTERTHLCGSSLGAMVAIRFAARHPDRVDRLVVSGGQVRPARIVMTLQVGSMRRTPEEKFAKQGIDKQKAIAVVEGLAKVDLRPDLRLVQAPTLVLVGARERGSFAVSRLISKRIKQGKLGTIKGAHPLNTASPGDYNTAMVGFLTNTD